MYGSAMEMTPIISIDGYSVTEKEGCITQIIHSSYIDAVYSKSNIYNDWAMKI